MLFAVPSASDDEIKIALQAANAWDFVKLRGLDT
jgi:hypothetical protein